MAEKNIYVDLDLNQQAVRSPRLDPQAGDPAAPVEGQAWYNEAEGRMSHQDGSQVRRLLYLEDNHEVFQVSGQWLMDPNEVNTWGLTGVYDPTNTQDVGNVGLTSVAWAHGGLMFPYDVRLVRFKAVHRINNVDSEAFGWVLLHAEHIEDSTAARVATYLLDEVGDNGGVGPRDYANTRPQIIDETASTTGPLSDEVIPAGRTISLGIASPTAIATNRYVQVLSGFLEIARVY